MRSIATLGDIYGPDAGTTFYNNNAGAEVGMAGTGNGGATPDMASHAAVSPISTFSGIRGTLIGNGVFQWFMILFVAVGVYALAKRHVPNIESDLSVPRISIPSFWSIGIQAFLFLVIVKTLLKKYNIPGLSGLAANA